MPQDFFSYWGKSSPGEKPEKHLLAYHALDVASVGAVLLEQHPTLLNRLGAIIGIPQSDLCPWLLWPTVLVNY